MTALRLAAIAFVAAACSNDTPSPSRTQTQPAHPPAQPPVSLLDGTRPLHMRNCPSGVAGAKTTFGASETGVDIVITADDPAARDAIVSRAQANAAATEPTMKMPHGLVLHSGTHTGRGIDGFCPIMHTDTIVTVEEIPAGVIVHMQPRDNNALPALRDAVRARIQAIAPSS